MAKIQRKAEVKYYDLETNELLEASATTYQAFACDVCNKWAQSREIPDNWYLVWRMIDFPRNEREEAHICSADCLRDYAAGVAGKAEKVAA